MMNKKISSVTFHYMIITGGFWMAFCVVTVLPDTAERYYSTPLFGV